MVQLKRQKKQPPVCGSVFVAISEKFWRTQAEQRAYSNGFWVGQMEKIYVGACTACMFRPNLEKRPWAGKAIRSVARKYGLRVLKLENEFWVMKHKHAEIVFVMSGIPKNSKAWHAYRAMLCGFPPSEIDLEYHTLPDFGTNR